jgi:Ca-activated chloride channel family protein
MTYPGDWPEITRRREAAAQQAGQPQGADSGADQGQAVQADRGSPAVVNEKQKATRQLGQGEALEGLVQREQQVNGLLRRANDLRRGGQYEDALASIEEARTLDPNNVAANAMKEMVKDTIVQRDYTKNLRDREVNAPAAKAPAPGKSVLREGKANVPDELTPTSDSGGGAKPGRSSGLGAAHAKSGAGTLQVDDDVDLKKALDTIDAPPAEATELKTTAAVPDRGTAMKGGQREMKEVTGEDKAKADYYAKREAFANKVADSIVAYRSAAATQPAAPFSLAIPAPAPAAVAVPSAGGQAASGTNTAPAAMQQETLLPASVFKAGPVNPWVLTQNETFSTFALDVDTASYAIARNYLSKGYLPPPGAVRMEEFINAFDCNYPRTPPNCHNAFNIYAEAAPAPFAAAGQNLTLLKIGVQGKVIGREGRKPVNLVLVVDTSGSMARADRLPLVQYALEQLVRHLAPQDRVALVTFGTRAGMTLAPTAVRDADHIVSTIRALQCSGTTNMSEGLKVGYEVARQMYQAGQVNRVVLCSDGMANIGPTEAQDLLGEVSQFRGQGVTFTSVGFGMGGYNDEVLQKLADKGDGSYVFVDTQAEARRVFEENISATLQPIARDAKIQVEFNPKVVRRFRLIGYEKRALEKQDFRNDAVQAAAVGSGQSSTALYELELNPDVDWRHPRTGADEAPLPLGTVFVRYRDADTEQVVEISRDLEQAMIQQRTVESDPRFYLAAGVAEFAQLLRQSPHVQGASLSDVVHLLNEVAVQLPLDNRVQELRNLAQKAVQLREANAVAP